MKFAMAAASVERFGKSEICIENHKLDKCHYHTNNTGFKLPAGMQEFFEISSENIFEDSTSIVIRVREKSSRREFACKILTDSPTTGSDISEGRDAVAQEVLATVAASRHRSVINVHSIFESGDRVFMVMDKADGGDLFDTISKCGRLREKDAQIVTMQLLEAISYIHSLNMCHRDIKLENIVLMRPSDFTQVRIVDFGLAYQAQDPKDLSCMARACGTPAYLAPECFAAELTHNMASPCFYGPECDVWSLGVVLFSMLSARLPFTGHTLQELARNIYMGGHLDMSGERWRCISPEAKDLVLKMLVRDPSKRITIKDALSHPWIVGASHPVRTQSLDETRSRTADAYSHFAWTRKRGNVLRSKLKKLDKRLPWE